MIAELFEFHQGRQDDPLALDAVSPRNPFFYFKGQIFIQQDLFLAQSGIGSFAGVLGGTDATSMSGGIHLDGDFVPESDNEEEFGIFVLNQCGTAGEAAICAGVDDVDE